VVLRVYLFVSPLPYRVLLGACGSDYTLDLLIKACERERSPLFIMPGPGQLKEMIRQLEHAENNLQALSQETVGSTGLDKVYRAKYNYIVL
jgi:hypothetical protein